jgi:uncharacterized protein YunC (DUF1805 family)
MSPALIVVDSATALPGESAGAVAIVGSHAGVYAAWLSARAGLAAAVHHDAGIGRDGAGIGGLAWAERFGFAFAAVRGATARIGDGSDMRRRGRIGHANRIAAACGVVPGMAAAEAAERLARAAPPFAPPPPVTEARTVQILAGAPVACVDSISLVAAEDAGRVVCAGSHGGFPAARYALDLGALLVVFNDAGDAADGSGTAGLALLDEAGRAAAAVAAASARIGSGASTLAEGVLSAVNAAAAALGLAPGMTARDAALRVIRRGGGSARS